jgi:thiol-disulfide isomerase/thioredoxin
MAKRFLAILTLLTLCSFVAASDEGDALVAKIQAMKPPPWDQAKSQDAAWTDEFRKKLEDFNQDRNDLIWKLFLTDPKNAATPGLMEERWDRFSMVRGGPRNDPIYADIDKVLAMKPGLEIVEVAKFCRADLQVGGWISDPAPAINICDEFANEFPKSKRAPTLYLNAVYSTAQNQRSQIYRAFLAKFPDHEMSPLIRGGVRQAEEVGKAFNLVFKDPITGKTFDIKDCRGKVVLVDFWATWCGPCVEKIPELLKLQETFGSRGLQIVGVSLDMPEKEGGLTKLKEFVSTKKLVWPQFYEGVPIQKSFAASWGIVSIPTVFLIDKKGNLREVGVRNVEESVKKLLAEKE